MLFKHTERLSSGIFITFSGNCRKALTFYQTCFGGDVSFETFERELQGFTEKPVISGTLISESVVIHGSDLVHSEGRKIGNYLSIFLPCKNVRERKAIAEKLAGGRNFVSSIDVEEQSLVEVIDIFDVRWVLGIE